MQKAHELQTIMRAVIAADTNGDFVLTEDEFDRLILRLEAFNMVDKERLRGAMLHSSMGKSIMSLHRDLEQEILKDDPSLSMRKLNVPYDDSGCGDDSRFVYQCMD